jgi:hypothetical protein
MTMRCRKNKTEIIATEKSIMHKIGSKSNSSVVIETASNASNVTNMERR